MDDEDREAKAFEEISKAIGHLHFADDVFDGEEYDIAVETAIEKCDDAISELSKSIEEDVVLQKRCRGNNLDSQD